MSDKCLFVLMTALAINLASAGTGSIAPKDTFTLWCGWIPHSSSSSYWVQLNNDSCPQHLSKVDICSEIEDHIKKLPRWAQNLLEQAYHHCGWYRKTIVNVINGLDLQETRLRFCLKFAENMHLLDEMPQPPPYCVWSTILCYFSKEQRVLLENAVQNCPLPTEVLERFLVEPVGNSHCIRASPWLIFTVSFLTLSRFFIQFTGNLFFDK